MSETSTLGRSWLVQRLTKPHGASTIFGKDNPFAFGGGLRNGGLSDEAMDLLRGIFAFDYMGAAEFEFGAVPKALQKMGGENLVASSFDVPLSEVAPSWKDESKPTGSARIFVLCDEAVRDEVEARVREWAGESFPRLKEGLRLSSTLRPVDRWDGDVVGWLELDNGFMFFTDEAMWSATAALFGVEAS